MALEIDTFEKGNKLCQKSISFNGPSAFNKLSNKLNILSTTTSFTHNCKKLALKNSSE